MDAHSFIAFFVWSYWGGHIGLVLLHPQIARELRELVRRRLPEGGPRGGLPGLVHGLGLLAVTGMALTGVAVFVLLPEGGDLPASAHSFHGRALVHRLLRLVLLGWTHRAGAAPPARRPCHPDRHVSPHRTLVWCFTLGGPGRVAAMCAGALPG